MRYWKFLQKTKLKRKFFANSEGEVGNFFQDWDHRFDPPSGFFSITQNRVELFPRNFSYS